MASLVSVFNCCQQKYRSETAADTHTHTQTIKGAKEKTKKMLHCACVYTMATQLCLSPLSSPEINTVNFSFARSNEVVGFAP